MPITRSAIKQVRQISRKTAFNHLTKRKYKDALRAAKDAIGKKDMTAVQKAVPAAFKQIDLAAKKHVIHWKTAARRKSLLARMMAGMTGGAKQATKV